MSDTYLEAYTKETLLLQDEFGTREGNVMVIVKALYGLRTN
jgi:hypothetical protein